MENGRCRVCGAFADWRHPNLGWRCHGHIPAHMIADVKENDPWHKAIQAAEVEKNRVKKVVMCCCGHPKADHTPRCDVCSCTGYQKHFRCGTGEHGCTKPANWKEPGGSFRCFHHKSRAAVRVD